MRRLLVLALLLFGTSAISFAGGQPDRTAALDKAKTKFEADIAKAEEALLASIDKTVKQAEAAKNKQLVEKLTLERELFVKHRLVPTLAPTATYLKQRSQSIAALETAYAPFIKELTKAKKDEDAESLENALSNAIKTTRGYGLALPDLEGRTFLIENKVAGLVIEASNPKEGTGHLVLGPKVGKRKPSQCWQLEREVRGYIIRNAASGQTFAVPSGDRNLGTTTIIWPVDPAPQTPPQFLFELIEVRREIVISPICNGLILTTTAAKQKGATVLTITQEKKEEAPTDKQRWVFTEAK